MGDQVSEARKRTFQGTDESGSRERGAIDPKEGHLSTQRSRHTPGNPQHRRIDTDAIPAKLAAAEMYATAGLRVLPLHTVRADGSCSCDRRDCSNVGKHPVSHLVPRGFKDATTDLDRLRSWWKQGDWNIGVVPGPSFAVLDVDPRKPGELERITKIVDRYGDFAHTLRMATGRYQVDSEPVRGHHYWFALPAGAVVNASKVEGIEVKSTGGYVVMPPSRHASGVNYEVEHGSLSSVADAPLWLIGSAPQGAEHARSAGETNDVTGEALGRRARLAIEQGYVPEPDDGSTQRSLVIAIVRNFKANGNTQEAAEALLRRLLDDERSSLDPARPWLPKHAATIVRSVYGSVAPDHDSYARRGGENDGRVTLKRYDSIERKVARWLWEGRIPRGALTVLVGDPGLGKSQLTARLAQMVTANGGIVVIASAEDSPAHTIVPRLVAAGADLGLVHHVALVDEHGVEGDIRLPKDIALLRAQVEAIGGVDLFVIDPVMAHMGERIDSYKDADVRKALSPLAQFAQDFDCAVVAVAHLNKGASTNATYRVGGSIGFTAAARSVLVLGRDPDDTSGRGPHRILANTKNNLGPEAPSLRCTVEPVLLDPVVVDGHVRQPLATTSKIVIGDETEVTGAQLLAAGSGDPSGGARTAVDEAKQFLLAQLDSGPVRSKDLLAAATRSGITEITLRRAKDALSVVAKQRTGAQHAGWIWMLPEHADSPDQRGERLSETEVDDQMTDRLLDAGDLGSRDASDDASSVSDRSPDRETSSTEGGGVDA